MTNCCVCSGNCCHVGPCAVCWQHGGHNPPAARNPGFPGFPMTTFFPSQTTCEHCYCRMSLGGEEVPHRLCCKCHNTLAEAFVPEAQRILPAY